MKRAVRRHHRQRLITKRRHYYRTKWTRAETATFVDHACQCSGPCCGNPRRWYKTKEALTMQERRFLCESV